jgi:hypothetical protein
MFYNKLNIEDFENLQNEIVPYVVNYVTSEVKESEQKFSEKVSFNFVSDEDLKKFKEDIPELFECIRRELGSEIIFMAFVYIDGIDSIPIHIDGDNSIEKRIRLHWPILNEKSAATIFYKKNDENLKPTFNSYKSGVNGWIFNSEDCHEVDRYILDTPTLNNVKEIHGVEILDDKLPRILLTMRLSNEEEIYQKYF